MSESSEASRTFRPRLSPAFGTARGLLGFAAMILIIAGAIVSWQRTLIPSNFEGTVQDVSVYQVDQPGVDDWVSMRIGHQQITTGNDALTCLREGAQVEKSALSRRVLVDGNACELPVPREALTDTFVPLVLIATLVALTRPRQRTS